MKQARKSGIIDSSYVTLPEKFGISQGCEMVLSKHLYLQRTQITSSWFVSCRKS